MPYWTTVTSLPQSEQKGAYGPAGRRSGHLIEYDWDGNVVWEHVDHFQHHDFRRQKDGNTVYVAWELLDEETGRSAGGLRDERHLRRRDEGN